MMVLIISGCSQNSEISTEYETVPMNEASFFEEAVTIVENGNMYTYSYSYTNDEEIITGKVFILKMNSNLLVNEINAFADAIVVNDNEYVAVDYRHLSDPDIQVRNSYRANTEKERQCIIDILLQYEESYPSDWERSVASLKNEWYWHNSAYEAGYSTLRAKHVNFNNGDEKNYPTLNPLKNE